MSDETCCGACGYPVHATKDSACDWCRQTADRIEALLDALEAARAERAKAVDRAIATLAEIKGESHE